MSNDPARRRALTQRARLRFAEKSREEYGLSLQRATGGLLVIGFITFLVGALMFVGRGGLDDTRTTNATYLIWERGLIMCAVILTTLGFALMDKLLEARGDTVFARLDRRHS